MDVRVCLCIHFRPYLLICRVLALLLDAICLLIASQTLPAQSGRDGNANENSTLTLLQRPLVCRKKHSRENVCRRIKNRLLRSLPKYNSSFLGEVGSLMGIEDSGSQKKTMIVMIIMFVATTTTTGKADGLYL